MRAKFLYFCLGIRHESLGMVGLFCLVFFFPCWGNLEQLLRSATCIPVAARKVFCPLMLCVSLGGSAVLPRGFLYDGILLLLSV